jgi:hypothetical protein
VGAKRSKGPRGGALGAEATQSKTTGTEHEKGSNLGLQPGAEPTPATTSAQPSTRSIWGIAKAVAAIVVGIATVLAAIEGLSALWDRFQRPQPPQPGVFLESPSNPNPVTSMTLGTYLLQGDVGPPPGLSYSDKDQLSAGIVFKLHANVVNLSGANIYATAYVADAQHNPAGNPMPPRQRLQPTVADEQMTMGVWIPTQSLSNPNSVGINVFDSSGKLLAAQVLGVAGTTFNCTSVVCNFNSFETHKVGPG